MVGLLPFRQQGAPCCPSGKCSVTKAFRYSTHPWVVFSRGRYAIDLFAPEGTPVIAVSRGVVVLADRDWSPENLFSTTSRKGGNAVIVFDPDRDRFYRYCHLSYVKMSSGDLVAAGERLGDVGHSGLNASLAGPGRPPHFETNQYSDGQVRALSYQQLRTMLRGWRLSSSPVDRTDGSQAKPHSAQGHANR